MNIKNSPPVVKETVSVNGITVNISRADHKPLIILNRMASQNMGIWDTIWADFARYFQVANFNMNDLPGAKKLDNPGEGFRQLAQNCMEVASGLGHETFHIFGWNGGTQVAMRCAVDYAQHIESCILLDPFFELADMRKINKAIEFKRALIERPDRKLYAFYWVMAGLSPEFIENNFDEVEKLVAARLEGDKFVKSDTDRFFKWVHALRKNWIADQEFTLIKSPTLIVATELDNWHAGPTVTMARKVHQRIKNSELKIIEKYGGHFLVENPKKFISVTEPFIRRVLRAG